MKNSKRILILITLVVVMLLGCSITANAAASTQATHECAFSLWNENMCYTSHSAGTHTYVREGKTLSCRMMIYCYRDYYKCACGAGEYRNYHNETKHLDCGL